MNYEEAYEQLHTNHKRFHGFSILPHVKAIAELVERLGPSRIIDYGCGKGYQYLVTRVHEQWGGILPYCYDAGIPQMRDGRIRGPFQGVICTDMLEHIEEADVDEVLENIFALADLNRPSFVFLTVSCSPARHKTLPDGRNVHLTVKPPTWWDEKFKMFERDGLTLQVVYEDAPA